MYETDDTNVGGQQTSTFIAIEQQIKQKSDW